jgi:hypothetical protein
MRIRRAAEEAIIMKTYIARNVLHKNIVIIEKNITMM